MRKDPPMPQEIEQGFYPSFEKSWHLVEITGRTLLFVFVAACLLGFLGDGLFSHRTLRSGSGELQVRYEPVTRFATPAHFDVSVLPHPQQKTIVITLQEDEKGAFGLQQISPEPLRQAGSANHPQITVAVQEDGKPLHLRFSGVPDQAGSIAFTISQEGGESLSWNQFVTP